MKFFWLAVVLFTLFFGLSEVMSDFSDSIYPSREQLRNRDHRTMRVNMRVGKRFGDRDLDDDVINKRNFLSPKRRLRLIVRPGKRFFGSPEYPRYYRSSLTQDDLHNYRTEPKRKLRLVMRTGKRTSNMHEGSDVTLIPKTHYDTLSSTEDTALPKLPESIDSSGLKRSAPQFLLNPRIGKNDRNWKSHPDSLQKRNDPKASDMWFGPRIGRSNEKLYEDTPWNYIIFNGNRQESDMPIFKSSEIEEQPNEESSEQQINI